MPRWALTDNSVNAEYNRFNLVDDGYVEQGQTDPLSVVLDAARWFEAGPLWLALYSEGDSHFPEVRVEAWPAPPPLEGPEWKKTAETEFSAPSGLVRLWALTGPSLASLPVLGGPRQRVRLHTRGGEDAAQAHLLLAALPDDDPDPAIRGVEHWLIQLWPTGVH